MNLWRLSRKIENSPPVLRKNLPGEVLLLKLVLCAKKLPRVLLALGWYDHRVHQGITKYALQAGWHLSADVTKEKVIP